MSEWIDCNDRMPPERPKDQGTVSEEVEVLLNTGDTDRDFLINGRWVWHCRLDDTGGYPVKWRD